MRKAGIGSVISRRTVYLLTTSSVVGLLFSSFVPLPMAVAQNAALAPIELQGLLKEVFLAYGGKESLAKLDNNYILIGDQTAAAGSESGAAGSSASLHFRQARKGTAFRIDVEPGGDSPTVSTVYDGMSAWKSTGKLVQDVSDAETKVLSHERDHEPSVLTHYGDAGYVFKLEGPTTYHAVPVYAVSLTKDDGDTETIFIDQKNYLVVGISYKGTDPDSKATADIAVDYSEYRPSAGTLFPFRQVQYVNDKPASQLNVASIDTNSEVDAMQFRRPDRPEEIRLSRAVTVPFEYTHKEIIVKVRINESEPMDFLLDTAASQTVIDRRVAAENFLDKQGSFPVMAAGGMVPTQMTTINKMTLGDVDIGNVQALMLDLSPQARQMGKPIGGILGENVLKRFAITVDYTKQQVVFNDANSYKPPAGATVVGFTQKQGPTVKASLNGTNEVTFLVDTGAAFNNLPTKIADHYLTGQTPHTTEGTGLDGRPVKLATLVMPTVKIGSQSVRAVTFTYSVDQDKDAKTAQKGVVQGGTLGVLGNPFWQNFLVTFDYKFQRLVLQPNAVLSGGRAEVEQLMNQGDSKLVIYRDLRAAEAAYEKALLRVQSLGDPKLQARVWGRIGNLRRVMAKDLNRPEQARIAYEYFSKAQDLARKLQDREAEGRILADWSLLYLDNGQVQAAQQALQGATLFAPQDPQVNVDFAVYLYKMQAYADMQKYVEKALFLEPSNWQALWYKVKLSELFSDSMQLKDTLKEILKYYPWSKLAKDKMLALTNPPPMTSVPGASPQPAGGTGSLPQSSATPTTQGVPSSR